MNDLAAKLVLGGIVGRSKPTNAWNRLDALFSATIKQLKTLDPTHQLHRVVWFHCVGLDMGIISDNPARAGAAVARSC